MTQIAPISSEITTALFEQHGTSGQQFIKDFEQTLMSLLDIGNSSLNDDNFQLAEDTYKHGILLAKSFNSLEWEAKFENMLSCVMDIQGNQIEALNLLEKSHKIYIILSDIRGQSIALCNIGGIKASLGQFDDALGSLKEGLRLSRTISDFSLTIRLLINIGFNCFNSGMYKKSLDYYREARDLSVKHEQHSTLINCLLNEGDALIHEELFEEAKIVLDEALDTSRLHNISQFQIESLDSLGCYYEKVGDWREAALHHEKAHQLAKSIDYAEGELNAVLNLGRVNVDHGDPTQAAEQLHEALRLATVLERPKSRRDAHQHLSRLYKQTGQPLLALEHFEAFHKEDHELSSAERDKTTRTLMMQFDVERAQTQTKAEREQREHAEQLQAKAEELVRERTADLEQAQMEVVGRMAMAAEFRDDATGEHTRRVGVGAALIAGALGLSREFTETLQIAARLHDVGKIGIPDSILLKAGKLSVQEFEEMKRHTTIGARLLSGGKSEVLNMARQIALTHHERWDGNGYPHGLAGSEIPLVGRIVALADVFDALMHKRPYKVAWDKAEVLAELAKQRGRHFDPELTDAALLVFGSGRYEAALLSSDQQVISAPPSAAPEVSSWELEAMRLQYEQMLEARTRELAAARSQAEMQVDQLRRAALTDVLTGLHNRRAFEADLLVYADQARQDGRPLCLISLDLDGLKHVNDSGGHASGDALIVSVALYLQRHFEPSGRVYRMGGDEFTVLLWSDPQVVARELAPTLGALESELAQQGHAASVSAGYAHWPHDTTQPEHLLRLSDERMYAQKRLRKRRLPPPLTLKLA